jgi:LysR family glycine cleavage system transcriptional activator
VGAARETGVRRRILRLNPRRRPGARAPRHHDPGVPVRVGRGNWPGLVAEPLIESPLIAVASPAIARRLAGQGDGALANEALIGDAATWQHWFAAAGLKLRVRPVADFNDGGLMLQAAEHGLGVTLAREMLAADALADGRLVRLSAVAVDLPDSRGYYFVVPPALRQWRPVLALRRWLLDELAQAERQWAALRKAATPGSSTGQRARGRARGSAADATRRPATPR